MPDAAGAGVRSAYVASAYSVMLAFEVLKGEHDGMYGYRRN